MNRSSFPRRVIRYQTKTGDIPFDSWLKSLRDAKTRAIILSRLQRVEGGVLGVYGPVGEGVFEFKFDFGPGFRVYFGFDQLGRLVVLLGGGNKSKQQRDIKAAHLLWKAYLEEVKK